MRRTSPLPSVPARHHPARAPADPAVLSLSLDGVTTPGYHAARSDASGTRGGFVCAAAMASRVRFVAPEVTVTRAEETEAANAVSAQVVGATTLLFAGHQ